MVLAVILFAAALIRLRLLSIPFERDEGEYAYAGQLMLQGIPPYSVASNMKLPGTYAAHAVIMACFGETIVAVHLGLLLVNAATILLVFFLGKRLFGAVAGVAAAAAYASLSLSPAVGGTASHATHFVTLFALAATVLLIRRPAAAFWPGLLYGLAFLMKQHGIFFAMFGALYLLRRRSGPRTLATFAGGAALPYALTCLILWRAGVFPNFWFWTVTYAREYAARVPFATGVEYLRSNIQDIWAASPALWAIAALGLFLFFGGGKCARARPSLWLSSHSHLPQPVPACCFASITSYRCCRRWRCWRARRSQWASQSWSPAAFSRRSSRLLTLLLYSLFAIAAAYPFFNSATCTSP